MKEDSPINITRLVPRMRLSSTEEERTRSAESHPVEFNTFCIVEHRSQVRRVLTRLGDAVADTTGGDTGGMR